MRIILSVCSEKAVGLNRARLLVIGNTERAELPVYIYLYIMCLLRKKSFRGSKESCETRANDDRACERQS